MESEYGRGKVVAMYSKESGTRPDLRGAARDERDVNNGDSGGARTRVRRPTF